MPRSPYRPPWRRRGTFAGVAAPWVVALSPSLLGSAGAQLHYATSESVGVGPTFAWSKQWRVINMEPVTQGWGIGELRMYGDTGCSELLTRSDATIRPHDADQLGITRSVRLTHEPIASGHREAPPDRAFDELEWTPWRSQCFECESEEAWLGLHFNEEVGVYCVEMWQWGHHEYTVPKLALQLLNEQTSQWETVLHASDLDGSRWEQFRFIKCVPLDPPLHGRVDFTNDGYYPSVARITCSGAHVLFGPRDQYCLPSGEWSAGNLRCWSSMEIVILVFGCLGAQFLFFALYFIFERFPKDAKAPPLHEESFLSTEHMGRWHAELMHECNQDFRYLACCIFCCPCRVADTWRGAGLMSYSYGICIPQCLFFAMPCIGGYLRTKIRDRFHIRTRVVYDYLIWCFCWPAAIIQEAKQVDIMCRAAYEDEAAMRDAEARRKARAEQEQAHRNSLRHTEAHSKDGKGNPIGKTLSAHYSKAKAKAKSTMGRGMTQTNSGPRQQRMLKMSKSVIGGDHIEGMEKGIGF